MNTWLYPESVQRVEQACHAFLSRQSSIEQVQAALLQSEQEIVALDEKWLRSALFEAENKLEEIKFTVSDDKQAEAADEVVRHVLQTMKAPPA
ncbi:hypothetical protein [Bordetella sp. BOR01]|uniref:hypothetical protein n=1 Tax=Bordetella sp. BOR01 TaxID=2854779 RepID=UPI001C44CD07|nr:hypothetical protein [Bordetella sp. BOR01]MBV7485430.1 hypothetical protein [Bordetella sp. BOR01]